MTPETFRCWCGGKKFAIWTEGRYETPAGRAGEFAVWRCVNCDTGHTQPVPIEVDYSGTPIEGNDRVKEIELWQQFADETIAVVKQYRTGGRLLDIGCNIGILVQAAARAGFSARGVDMDRNAVEYGRQNFQLDLMVGQLGDIDLGRFDVVLLEQTLEHCREPLAVLSGLEEKIENQGILLISVPNYRGLMPRILGASWYGYWPWEHIWHFSPLALERLAAASGWQVRGVHRTRLYHPHSWQTKRQIKESLVDIMAQGLGLGDKTYLILER